MRPRLSFAPNRRPVTALAALAAIVAALVFVPRLFGGPDLPALADLPIESADQAARASEIGRGIVDGHSWVLRVAGDGGTDPVWHLTVDGRVALTEIDGGGSVSGGEFRANYFGRSTDDATIRVRHVIGMPDAASVRVFGKDFEQAVEPVLRLLNDSSDGWFVVVIATEAQPVTGLQVLDADGALLWSDSL